jgi:hypothetical protein
LDNGIRGILNCDKLPAPLHEGWMVGRISTVHILASGVNEKM